MIAGTLEVQMLANLARLADDMKKAERLVGGSVKNIEKYVGGLKGALGAIGVGLGFGAVVAAFTSMFNEAVRVRSALDDLSDTTGDNVTTLDALRRQAYVSGVQFDQVGSAVTKLARNLNNADEEGEAAAQALKAVGLEVDVLRAMKPADAMLEVAKALEKFDDGAGKVAVSVALMGKEGAKMLPFMKDLIQDGDAVGKITAEQAKQAEELEKSWRRLTLAFKDGKDAIAGDLIPWLAKLIEDLREGTKIAGGFWNAIFTLGTINPFKSQQSNMADLRVEIEKLTKARDAFAARGDMGLAGQSGSTLRARQQQLEFLKLQQRQEALLLVGPEFMDARDLLAQRRPTLDPGKLGGAAKKISEADPFGDLMKKLAMDKASLESEKNLFVEMSVLLREDKKLRDGLTESQKQLVLQEAARIMVLKDVKAQQKEVNDGLLEAAKAAVALDEKLEDQGERYKDLIDPMRKYQRELEMVALLEEKGKLTAEQAALVRANVDDRKWMEIFGTATKETEKLDDAWRDLGLTFSSAFENAVIGGMKLRDVVNALGNDIARIIARKTITEPLANAVGGMFSSGGGFGDWISGLFGGGMTSGTFGSAAVVGMPGYASGTDFVPRDGPAFLHKGEKVIPAGESDGGVSVTINAPIDARGADAGVVQRIEAGLGQLERSIVPRITDALRRNAIPKVYR
jgi:hypothetical protein